MKQYLPLLPVLQMLSMSPCATAQEPREPPVGIETGKHGETHYTVDRNGCRFTWTVFDGELNRGVVRHRSDCAFPISGHEPSIAALLKQVLRHKDGAWEFHTLNWGRLFGDGARDSTMAERLALAALSSDGWNRSTGRPRGGDINRWVKALGESAAIHVELRSLFRNMGLRLEIASVEKVLVLEAGQLPFFPRLSAAGARPSDKLPFDCQIWFSVRRAGGVKP